MPDKLKQSRVSLTNISSLNPLVSPARKLRLSSARSSDHRSETMPARLRRFRGRDIGFAYAGKRKLNNERGQTLVELMIAMSVMSIGFLAVFAVLSQTLGMNKIIVNQYIAANLAAEGIEIVKNISDSNVVRGDVWNAGLSSDKFGVQYDTGTLGAMNKDWANRKLPLNFNPDTGMYSYDVGMPTNFVRTITINNISPNEIQVNSEVRWRDRGGIELNINLEDHLFNWH